MEIHEEARRGFQAGALAYERGRPGYPAAAIGWLCSELDLRPKRTLLDVGAGTGKLTRGLVALGFDTVAVEPGAPMLAQLRGAVPEAEAHEGSAEAIPLPDSSVDAGFAGQAFHWFDPERALPELHRVIKPGGGLALLWNWWDERDPLQAELGVLIGYAGHQPYRDDELPGAPWFRELGRIVVESAPESSPEELAAQLATTSAFLTAEREEREETLRSVHKLASGYGERFPLPRLTYVFALARLGDD